MEKEFGFTCRPNPTLFFPPLRSYQYSFDLVYLGLHHRFVDKRRMKIAFIHSMSLQEFFEQNTIAVLPTLIVPQTWPVSVLLIFQSHITAPLSDWPPSEPLPAEQHTSTARPCEAVCHSRAGRNGWLRHHHICRRRAADGVTMSAPWVVTARPTATGLGTATITTQVINSAFATLTFHSTVTTASTYPLAAASRDRWHLYRRWPNDDTRPQRLSHVSHGRNRANPRQDRA